MKLFHLGQTYSHAPIHVETVETAVECQFLGNRTPMRVAKQVPARATQTLKYRGACYQA